jgi:chemotaxis protein MotB
MKKTIVTLGRIGVVSVAVVMLAGCPLTIRKSRPEDEQRIRELTEEVRNLAGHLDELTRVRERETSELAEARRILEESLKEQKGVTVTEEARGVVITFVAEVLFDSGKAKIREEGYDALNKVARVLNEVVPGKDIAIEGHTDNEPIKYSGWKSNWELSSARTMSVLHYFEEKDVVPGRMSGVGYGEYRPVETNDTAEGRQKNRRVEIVIMPEKIEKVKGRLLEQTEEAEEVTK